MRVATIFIPGPIRELLNIAQQEELPAPLTKSLEFIHDAHRLPWNPEQYLEATRDLDMELQRWREGLPETVIQSLQSLLTFCRGYFYKKSGNPIEAARLFEQVCEVQPSLEGWLEAGNSYFDSGNVEDAIRCFRNAEAAAIEPGDVLTTKLAFAQTHLHLLDDFEGAERYYQSAAQDIRDVDFLYNVPNVALLYNLGEHLLSMAGLNVGISAGTLPVRYDLPVLSQYEDRLVDLGIDVMRQVCEVEDTDQVEDRWDLLAIDAMCQVYHHLERWQELRSLFDETWDRIQDYADKLADWQGLHPAWILPGVVLRFWPVIEQKDEDNRLKTIQNIVERTALNVVKIRRDQEEKVVPGVAGISEQMQELIPDLDRVAQDVEEQFGKERIASLPTEAKGSLNLAEFSFRALDKRNWAMVANGYAGVVESILRDRLLVPLRTHFEKKGKSWKLEVGEQENGKSRTRPYTKLSNYSLGEVAYLLSHLYGINNQPVADFIRLHLPSASDFLKRELPQLLIDIAKPRGPASHGHMTYKKQVKGLRDLVLGNDQQAGLAWKLMELLPHSEV